MSPDDRQAKIEHHCRTGRGSQEHATGHEKQDQNRHDDPDLTERPAGVEGGDRAHPIYVDKRVQERAMRRSYQERGRSRRVAPRKRRRLRRSSAMVIEGTRIPETALSPCRMKI